MKTQKILLLVFTFLFINGCNNKSEKSNYSTKENPTVHDGTVSQVLNERTTQNPSTKEIESVPLVLNRMIIKKGEMNLETEKYEESEKIIMEETDKLKGYITNSGSSINASGKKQGTIEVRLPSQNFDSFISGLNKAGKVMSVNITGNDVTEEFIDIEARHKTQKSLEERLIKLLNEKTGNLTDIVEVEEKLAEVRAQIESMEGKMRFLKNQSEYSTLTVSIFEPSLLMTSTGGGFFFEISEAFKEGLSGFTSVLTGLITFAVSFSPVIFFMIVLIIVMKKFIKRRINKSQVGIQTN